MRIVRNSYNLVTPFYKEHGVALLYIGMIPFEKIDTSAIDNYCLGSCVVKNNDPKKLTSDQVKEIMLFLDTLLEESPEVDTLNIFVPNGGVSIVSSSGDISAAIDYYLNTLGKQGKDDFFRYDVDAAVERTYIKYIDEYIKEKNTLL